MHLLKDTGDIDIICFDLLGIFTDEKIEIQKDQSICPKS